MIFCLMIVFGHKYQRWWKLKSDNFRSVLKSSSVGKEIREKGEIRKYGNGGREKEEEGKK